MPNSPPALPTIATSRTTSGASVTVSAMAGIEFPLDHALLATGNVDRVHRAPAVRDKHHAVLDQRGRFEIAEFVTAAALVTAERDTEQRFEVLDGLGIDLFELRKAPALIVAVVDQPIVRLLHCVERALEGHVGRGCRRECSCQQQRRRQCTGANQSLHRVLPLFAGRGARRVLHTVNTGAVPGVTMTSTLSRLELG